MARRRLRWLSRARCESCGSVLPQDATVCPACGAQVERSHATFRCRGCGARVSVEEIVCPICGRERPQRDWGHLLRFTLAVVMIGVVLAGGYMLWPHLPEVEEAQAVMGPTPTPTKSPYPSWTPSLTPSPTLSPTLPPTPLPSTTPTPGSSATPTPAPTATPVIETYTVIYGDSLISVAREFGMDVETLLSLNQLKRNATLVVDQELVVIDMRTPTPTLSLDQIAELEDTPTPTATETVTATATPGLLVHVVEAGDMLGSLAVKYDVDIASIAAANNVDTTAILHIGQELAIPGMTATPSATPTPTVTHTPTKAATPLPTLPPRPTTLALAYRTPRMLGPRDGSESVGGDVLLNWTSVAILNDDEWYEVRLVRPCGDEPLLTWTRATSWRLTADDRCQDPESAAYLWSVRIVRRKSGGTLTEELSLPSSVRTFTWLP